MQKVKTTNNIKFKGFPDKKNKIERINICKHGVEIKKTKPFSNQEQISRLVTYVL